MQPGDGSSRPFKQRRSLASRMQEVTQIRLKYPNKIPVVVERYQKEKILPPLSRTKFLVAQDLPLAQFASTLRTRLGLSSSQTFYLLVNSRGLPSMAVSMQELYGAERDEDGFLYLTYASQEMFGCSLEFPFQLLPSPHSRGIPVGKNPQKLSLEFPLPCCWWLEGVGVGNRV